MTVIPPVVSGLSTNVNTCTIQRRLPRFLRHFALVVRVVSSVLHSGTQALGCATKRPQCRRKVLAFALLKFRKLNVTGGPNEKRFSSESGGCHIHFDRSLVAIRRLWRRRSRVCQSRAERRLRTPEWGAEQSHRHLAAYGLGSLHWSSSGYLRSRHCRYDRGDL